MKRPGGQLAGSSRRASKSQLFPLLSHWSELRQKTFLVPVTVTVVFVMGMFATLGTLVYLGLLALYLTGAGYYFIYRLCGKDKPWWLSLGAALMTMLILVSPLLSLFIFIFRDLLPGHIPGEESTGFVTLLVSMFFGAGLMEELLKALPVLGAYWLGSRLSSPWRERVGVWEPLDGIVLGTASAAGFTLLETLGQYVPGITQEIASQHGEGVGYFVGLQLLIPRIVGAVAGHMAYSGYLGYFIGLSALKPASRWQVLGVGYFSAAGLHALWNSADAFGVWFSVLVGSLSYIFLAAAILKARQISPTRSQNFATQVLGGPPANRFSLQLGSQSIVLCLGVQLCEQDIPGVAAQFGNGIIAEVNQHPHDPAVLGLKNLSRASWTVTSAAGTRQLDFGQSIKLAVGTGINFGVMHGVVR